MCHHTVKTAGVLLVIVAVLTTDNVAAAARRRSGHHCTYNLYNLGLSRHADDRTL